MKNKNVTSDFYDCFGYEGFWLYEWISKLMKRNGYKNVLKVMIVTMIVPPFIIFLPELFLRWKTVSQFSMFTVLALVLAGTWSLIGPLCIYMYHQKLVHFAKRLQSDPDIPSDIPTSIFNKIMKNYNRNIFLIGIVWSFLVLIIFILNPDCMDLYGFYGFHDIYFILLLLYFAFILNLNACGLYFVVITARIIVEFSKRNIIIQNMLENNQYNIKVFGNLSCTVTLCLATGFLYFPILFDFCRVNKIEIANLTFIPVIVYFFVLIYSYVYPNYKICMKAFQEKEKMLLRLQAKYVKSMKTLDEKSDIEQQLHMNNLYQAMRYVERLNVYPTNVKNVIVVFSTVILPISLFFIDKLDFLYEPLLHTLLG